MDANEDIQSRRDSHSRRGESDDEVKLIDCSRVLWKYRFWVIGATVLSALAALAISFLLPSVWEVSTVFEPGKFGSDLFETGEGRPSGKLYFVDTPQNIEAKIVQGAYDAPVNTLSGLPAETGIKWNVDVARGTHAVRVSLHAKDKALGLKALKALIGLLEKEHLREVEAFERVIQQEVLEATEDVTKVRKDIEQVHIDRDADLAKLHEEIRKLKKEIALLEQRKSELPQEEERIRKNTELLIANRNILIEEGKNKKDPLALILYMTSLQ